MGGTSYSSKTTTRSPDRPTRPVRTTTRPEGGRIDIGTHKFVPPATEDDRGPPIGNGALLEKIAGAFNPFGIFNAFLDNEEGGAHTDQPWGQVQQTSLDMLEKSGSLHKYDKDAVLVIANGPEDMKQLNQEREADAISDARGDKDTVVLWNPSPEALTAMVQEGGFRDVVWSGHGEDGQVFMTGADGEAVAVDGKQLAEMFADSAVSNIFLNVCQGAAGGAGSVAGTLAEAGMNAMGWTTTVGDQDASRTAQMWAQMTADGASTQDMKDVAQGRSNLETHDAKDDDPFSWFNPFTWF